VTTRGMREKEMQQIARWISEVLTDVIEQASFAAAPVKIPVDASAAGMNMVSEGGPPIAPEIAAASAKSAPSKIPPSKIEERVRAEVAALAARFPLYARRLAEADAAQHAHSAPASPNA
ncbi:MAG: hypothetical protein ACRD4A_04785, partial [Candidatus Acidiferrales bacterium]